MFNHPADDMIKMLLVSNFSQSEAMQRTRSFAALASLHTLEQTSVV